jgi:hypothetical protein
VRTPMRFITSAPCCQIGPAICERGGNLAE